MVRLRTTVPIGVMAAYMVSGVFNTGDTPARYVYLVWMANPQAVYCTVVGMN